MQMTNRRPAACILAGAAFFLIGVFTPDAARSADALTAKAMEIEASLGGRAGFAILDTETGTQWSYRAEERFPMMSTFKAFACAAVLARTDAGQEDLERPVAIEQSDLVTYSPVTEPLAGTSMTLAELCHATMTTSDNTAGNLVLRSLGGPEGFTGFMRSIGDGTTRLDRWETELNEARPGDPRDTTTPAAVAASLQKLVLGDVLSGTARRQLRDWLAGNEVADALLRASLPEGWRIGDRTGAGENGSRGIIAVIWPPERQPVLAAIYLTGTMADMDARNEAIAEIGGVLVQALAD